jgi:hypothetical protein
VASVQTKITDGKTSCIVNIQTKQNIYPVAFLPHAGIFPNPSRSAFVLAVENCGKQNMELEVADLYGRKVFSAKGLAEEYFSFGEDFPPGIYFVHVTGGVRTNTIKVLKAR